MIFLSHANPEDNEFTLWLALQLAREGYPVWCDLTKLLGGEDFWKDIQRAIRERTQKFVYVLSKTSNTKDGPLRELTVAQNVARNHGLHDFVIPAHIDDLPHREITIEIARLNVVGFKRGWADGLAKLLEKFEEDGVTKDARFGPQAVTSWWRTHFDAQSGVVDEPDECFSNWFRIQSLPEHLYFHKMHRSDSGLSWAAEELPYPAIDYREFVLSFAPHRDFMDELGDSVLVDYSERCRTADFLEGSPEITLVSRRERRKVMHRLMHRLLRVAWERFADARGLPMRELSRRAKSVYFTTEQVPDRKAFFTGVAGKTTYRSLVGYRNVRRGPESAYKRHWHFGIELKPLLYPEIAYVVKPHVFFSYDGREIWENVGMSHRARRSQCKDWWNPHWRDRILAAMSLLADSDGRICIPVSAAMALGLSSRPVLFTSPVSYARREDAFPMENELELEEDEVEEENEEDETEGVESGG